MTPDRSHLELHPGPEYDEPEPRPGGGIREALRRGIEGHEMVSSSVIHCGPQCVDSILVHAGLATWHDGKARLFPAALPDRPRPGITVPLTLLAVVAAVAVAVAWFALNGGNR